MSAPFQPSFLPELQVDHAPQSRRRRPVGRRVRRRATPRTDNPEQWPLEALINVVLFAGIGGACRGLEQAGYPVHVAVNHDEIAIAAHKALNPFTHHIQKDIYEVCPLVATFGRGVNILWASPDCRDHSIAKGGAPRSARVRSMPWQVCRWVGVLRKRGRGPNVVYLENVREIRQWGPLVAKRDKATGRIFKLVPKLNPKTGKAKGYIEVVAAKGEQVPLRQQSLVRDPKRLGKTFRAFEKHLASLSGTYEDKDLTCSQHGVPTGRKRLFGCMVFTSVPIAFPAVTHGHRKSAAVLAGKYQAEAPAASIIDWSRAMPSIFDRPRPLVANTQKRIAVGMKRFVLETNEPFLVHLTHHGVRQTHPVGQAAPTFTGAHRGEMSLCSPVIVPTTHSSDAYRVHDAAGSLPVLTAGVKGGEFAVMSAALARSAVIVPGIVGAGGRAAQMGPMDPAGALNTSTTKEDRALFAASLVEHRGASIGQPVDQALGSQTAFPHHGLVAANLIKFNENSIGQEMHASIDTIMAGAARFGVIAAHLTEFRSRSIGHDVGDPAATQTGTDHHGLVAAQLYRIDVEATGGEDRGFLGSGLPFTASIPGEYALVAGSLIRYHGERRPGEERVADVAGSLPTSTTENRFGVMAATLVGVANTGSTGRSSYSWSVDEALRTQTTSEGFAVAAAWLAQHNGDPRKSGEEAARPGRPAAEPLAVVTTDTQIGVAAATLAPVIIKPNHKYEFFRGSEVKDPLGTQTGSNEFGLAAMLMVQTGYGEREGQDPRVLDISASIGTQMAGGLKHAIIAAHITEFRGGHVGQDMRNPTPTITANGFQEAGGRPGGSIPLGIIGADLVPAATWMLQNNYLEPGHSCEDTVASIVTKVGPVALGAAYITHLYGTGTAVDVGNALPTQMTGGGKGGGHVGPTAAYLGKYYGVEGQGQRADVALDTLSTNDRFGLTGADLSFPPLTDAQLARARQVAEFLRGHGVWNGGEYVVVGSYIVIDIGMRMLTPLEAAAAHELVLPAEIEVRKRDHKGNVVSFPDGKPMMIKRPLTKTEAMRLVGNSVPARMAKLMAECNAVHTLAGRIQHKPKAPAMREAA
ncbi:MAG: hypothetical protein JWO51_176 [Rhodospirillales bacterium]|nr:hypothetical protein [Rhodospirillales bacterium]